MNNKQHWLDVAEVIDAQRIFPRAFLIACFVFSIYVTIMLMWWYTHLPHEERSLEASGFASVVFLGVWRFMQKVYDTYADGGRDWTAIKPPPVVAP